MVIRFLQEVFAAAVYMSAAAVRSAPAGKYPEAAKLAEDIRFVQDRKVVSVKTEASSSLRLSDLIATGSENDKMEERQRMLSALTELQKERFLLKKMQLKNPRVRRFIAHNHAIIIMRRTLQQRRHFRADNVSVISVVFDPPSLSAQRFATSKSPITVDVNRLFVDKPKAMVAVSNEAISPEYADSGFLAHEQEAENHEQRLLTGTMPKP